MADTRILVGPERFNVGTEYHWLAERDEDGAVVTQPEFAYQPSQPPVTGGKKATSSPAASGWVNSTSVWLTAASSFPSSSASAQRSLCAARCARSAAIAALRAHLAAQSDRWALALDEGKLLAAVNQTLVEFTHPLAAGDEVAFFPPVTGG